MPTSAGKKVSNPTVSPTTRENPGPVPQDSLAAESIRAGGEFSKNPAPSSPPTSTMHPNKTHEQSRTTAENQGEAQGMRAPTGFTPNAPTGGPHGKNIKEVSEWDSAKIKDGTQMAMNAEVGSKDDPARMATLGVGKGEKGMGEGGSFGVLGEEDA